MSGRSIMAACVTRDSVSHAYGPVFDDEDAMAELFKLRREHAVILRIVERLHYLVSQPSPPPQLHLFAVRYELTSTLIAHLKNEDWLVYPQLMASTDADIAARARALSDEMGGLAEAYREHCQAWDATAIAADWPGYCADSQSLIDAVNTRITRENRELFPLLERVARAA